MILNLTKADGGATGTAGSARRDMSAEQLLDLGVRQLVYLRVAMVEGERIFVLYGGDGIPLAAADELEAAVGVAVDRGLEFIAIH